MWYLYGKKYDLNDYLSFHPGGSTILENTRGQSDITALFETYHAFSNKTFYQKILTDYEVTDPNPNPNPDSYDFTNYRLLTERIRKIFPNRKSVKAPISWYILNGITLFLYLSTFYGAMFCKNNIWITVVFSQLAGVSFISLGFNVFHDASHYAISAKPVINDILAKIWASWGIWNVNLWFYHHVLQHHSHTGVKGLDPDLYHLRPFASKTEILDKNKKPLLWNKPEFLPFVMIVFPGYYVGQSLSYLAAVTIKNKIFRFILPIRSYYDGGDMLMILVKIYALYCGGFFAAMNYILALNFWYFINIALDHDTYETIVENHYSGKDWLKMQICHSGNFLNENLVWTRIFGSINYQIEHHLFPNMSSVHYPVIAPVVREFCQEHGIPYVHHDTLVDAFRSYYKMIQFRNSE